MVAIFICFDTLFLTATGPPFGLRLAVDCTSFYRHDVALISLHEDSSSPCLWCNSDVLTKASPYYARLLNSGFKETTRYLQSFEALSSNLSREIDNIVDGNRHTSGLYERLMPIPSIRDVIYQRMSNRCDTSWTRKLRHVCSRPQLASHWVDLLRQARLWSRRRQAKLQENICFCRPAGDRGIDRARTARSEKPFHAGIHLTRRSHALR